MSDPVEAAGEAAKKAPAKAKAAADKAAADAEKAVAAKADEAATAAKAAADDVKEAAKDVKAAASDTKDAVADAAKAAAATAKAPAAPPGAPPAPPPTAPAPGPQVTPSEPAPPAPQAQPIYVQAPQPPKQKGNRLTAGVIGLLAAIVFGGLYLLSSIGITLFAQSLFDAVPNRSFSELAMSALGSWGFWVMVIVFFLGFWLLGAIINRGRWSLWVILGLLVGLIALGGHVLGLLVEAPFWTLTASQGWSLVTGALFSPHALLAFLFGREVTIWFGAWLAKTGKRKTEQNAEAQREYERTLEAGPILSR